MTSYQKPSDEVDDKDVENSKLRQSRNLPPGYFAVLKQVCDNNGCHLLLNLIISL